MKLELVAIDLDGTLLRNDKSYDRDRFIAIKERLLSENIVLCIATGNSYHKIQDYFEEDIAKDLYFAVDNGNHILRNDETLTTKSIDHQHMLEIVDYLESIEDSQIVISTSQSSYFIDEHNELSDTIRFYNPNLVSIQNFEEIPEVELIFKIALLTNHSLDMNKSIVEQIKYQFYEIQSMTSAANWIDIIHLNGGKGAALEYIADKEGINLEHAIAFGDSFNDVTMLSVVGHSVAMHNADPEVKAYVQFEIGSNDVQSVLNILEQYIEKEDIQFLTTYRQK